MSDSVVVRIPSSVYEEFKAFVRARHANNFKKGHYMEELTNAVHRYMRTERAIGTHAYAQEIELRIPQKIRKGRDKMLGYLIANYQYEPGSGIVNVHHLKDAITYVFGSDERTVRKKIDELKKYEIIRPYGETFQFTPLVLEEIDGATIRNAAANKQKQRELENAFSGYAVINPEGGGS